MGWLDDLFTSKKGEQTQSTQSGTSNTQSNLWPQIQPFLQQYQQQYSNFGGANTPINAYQTGAAEGQAGVAGSLTGARDNLSGIADTGISPAAIQQFMDPYIASVVDPTLAAQKIQNEQAISGLKGNQAVRGALGNNTGAEAAYYAGVQPGQQKEIASLYSQGFNQAGQLATQDVNARMAANLGQGQLAGAQTGANTAGYNMGQGIWDSSFKNALTPYEIANQGVQGWQGFGNLAGSTTNTSGTASGWGQQTATPSTGGILSGLFGAGLSFFGKADGGAVEGLAPSEDANHNGIPDSLEQKVTKYFNLFQGLQKKARGGEVSGIEPYAEGGDVGLGSWMPTVTMAPEVTGPSKTQVFGDSLKAFGDNVDQGMDGGGSSLGAQSQALSSMLSGMGRAEGGEVDEEEGSPYISPYAGAEPAPATGIDPGLAQKVGTVQDATGAATETPPTSSWGFMGGVYDGKPMSPMQRLGIALTQVHDSPFAGFGKSLMLSDQGRMEQEQVDEAKRHNRMAELASMAKGTRKTALEQQLEAAGLKPGTPEYQKAILSYINKPATQISMQEESAYDKSLGGKLAEEFIKTQDGGGDAQHAMANLDVMQQALADPNLYTGTGGQTVQALKRAGETLFGVPVKGTASGEVAQSLGTELALGNREKLPGPMSNADREFLVEMGPSLSKTPEGNRLIIEIAMASKRWQIAQAEAAREYAGQNQGRLDAGWYAYKHNLDKAAAQEFGALFDKIKGLNVAAPRSPTVGTGLGDDPFGLRGEVVGPAP